MMVNNEVNDDMRWTMVKKEIDDNERMMMMRWTIMKMQWYEMNDDDDEKMMNDEVKDEMNDGDKR